MSELKDQSNRLFVLATLAVAVVGLAAVAVVATSRGDDSSTGSSAGLGTSEVATNPQTSPVIVDGTALPAMPEGVRIGTIDNDPAVGLLAPSLSGSDFDGSTVEIKPDGRPKVVYFVAHWCPHCQDEVPVVQTLIDDGQVPVGMDIYAVSTAVDPGRKDDPDAAYPPEVWLENEGFTPPVMRDSEQSEGLRSFGVGGFPYVVYLDGDNRVLGRTSGGLEASVMSEIWRSTAADS